MTPQLRFPEFIDEWQVKKLGDIFEYKSTNSLSRAQLGDTGSVSNIHYGDIHKSLPTHLDSKKYTLPKILNDSDGAIGDSVEVGDIVIADASEDYDDIGKGIELVSKGLNEEIRSGLHTFLMSPKEDTAVGYYGVALKSASIRRQFRRIATGISVLGVSKNNVSKIDIAIPSKPEQEKIADFLTAVDERIAVGEKKLELLETYKRGVMQKIFSQQIRFKDENGEDYPDWEEKKLGELIEIGSSKRVLQEDWKSEGIPFYRTREIINLAQNQCFRTPIFISEDLYRSLSQKYGAPRRGDLLASGVGSIGSIYLVDNDKRFYFKDGNVLWLKQSQKLNSAYLYQAFQTRFVQKQIQDNASITTVATFTIEGAKKTRILYPVIEEQQKVADFLSVLDNKIKLEEAKLASVKEFKKALLQRMFV